MSSNRKHMEYTVISSHLLHDLIRQVNEHLNYGWVVQGGISFASLHNDFPHYIQAMVRTKL